MLCMCEFVNVMCVSIRVYMILSVCEVCSSPIVRERILHSDTRHTAAAQTPLSSWVGATSWNHYLNVTLCKSCSGQQRLVLWGPKPHSIRKILTLGWALGSMTFSTSAGLS